jgi:hypothetical protein
MRKPCRKRGSAEKEALQWATGSLSQAIDTGRFRTGANILGASLAEGPARHKPRGVQVADGAPGVSAKGVSRIEKGKVATPHTATLEASAARTGVNVRCLSSFQPAAQPRKRAGQSRR